MINMTNTFFKKRKKKRMSFKIIIFGGLFFCVLAGLVYFSIWSSILQINKTEIQSEKEPIYYENNEIMKIAEEGLRNKIFEIIPQNNITLVPLNEIKNTILDNFSEIKQVDVSRDLSNLSNLGLIIKIEERENIGIWCKYENSTSTSTEKIINECFQIDKEGVIYRKSLLVKSNSVLNIYSSRNQSAVVRDLVVPLGIINFILGAKEKTPVLVSDFDFISIEDVKGTTSLGWQIYFNPAYSLDAQINTLKAVLDEQIKKDYESLEYIDLRIEGRVYYK